MKNATVRQLRNEFGRISKWIERGETVEIVKHGKPFAELIPKVSGRAKVLLGATPSSDLLPDDIDVPIDADWEALK